MSKNNKKISKNIDINKEKTKKEVIVEEIKTEETKKSFFRDTFVNNLIFVTLIVFLIEILFIAISDFELLGVSTLRIFLSSFILTFIITFLSSLTKRKWLKNTINLIYIFAYSVYTWLQLGFINYLGVYISFNTSSQLGAVTDYALDYLLSFKLVFYTIFLPFVAALIWYLIINRKRKWEQLKLNIKHLYLIPILIMSIALYYLTITIPCMQNEFQIKSNKKLFINPDVPTVAVNQFGTTLFGILDFKTFLFPVEEDNA